MGYVWASGRYGVYVKGDGIMKIKKSVIISFLLTSPMLIIAICVMYYLIPFGLSKISLDTPIAEIWWFPIILTILLFLVWGKSFMNSCVDLDEDNEDENEMFSPLWKCKCGITNDLREKTIQCSCGKFYGEIT